jgi:DNA-binding response OmpR family regulator
MKKILIVEDDRFLANAYQLAFEQKEYQVEVIYDGDEVIPQLDHDKPDVIVLDILLPHRDGFSILEELKASDKFKQIPVLIASNLGQEKDIQKGKELGAAGYIIKSDLSISEVIAKVEGLLGH